MTLTFDWFLPTSGDGRTIIGRGHSLPLGAASAARADRRANWRLAGMASAERQLHFPHRVHRPHPA